MTNTREDERFAEAAAQAADDAVAEARRALEGSGEWPHRMLMDRVKLFVACILCGRSQYSGDERLAADAAHLVRRLADLQLPSGLFRGGDNLNSPPDSAFTVNDVCDVLELVRRAPAAMREKLASVTRPLDEIADAAEPALRRGGVHTPNHRWEISAALARLHRRRPSDELAQRVSDWLAEGVDIDTDGLYSERSANYAAYVSNPSLAVIGDVFDRVDLHRAVVRNLRATIGMLLPDGTVETVHSRRQDQNSHFPLAPYLVAYRRWAVESGDGELAWAAQQALAQGVSDPATVLAETLLHPSILEPLPAEQPPAVPRKHDYETSSLSIDHGRARTLVVYGGSDYPQTHRVRSGLANNPTFARMFAGDAIMDSARLSRTFFGLGPFRAADWQREGETIVLRETVEAGYWQPLPRDARRHDGAYALEDDGRFHASMSFSQRDADVMRLTTTVSITPDDTGARIDLEFDGPETDWALDVAFREGEFEGGEALGNGDIRLADGQAVLRCEESRIVIEVQGDTDVDAPPIYQPGEEYEFLGATDAVPGRHAYVTGRTRGSARVTIRT